MARTKGSITRCGHCYEEGHNKRTCPEIKKEIESNPEGYYARRAKRKKRDSKPRKCSYCTESGHNRATCGQMKVDRTAYEHMNWKFQNKLTGAMKRIGLGVGAIVKQEHWGDDRYWLVTGLHTENINAANWSRQGMGNKECTGSPYALKVKRLDVSSLSEYDRTKAWNLDSSLYLPKELLEEAGLVRGVSSRDIVVVAPIDAKDNDTSVIMDRTSGSDFMAHENFLGGYATMAIQKIDELLQKEINQK